MVDRVREMALQRLRTQIAIAFDDDPRSSTTDRLARFALAAFDGAFVAAQTDSAVTLERLLEPLAPALVARDARWRIGRTEIQRRAWKDASPACGIGALRPSSWREQGRGRGAGVVA